MTKAVLAGYSAEAESLISRFEAISTEELLAPVSHLLPCNPTRIADIGAGTGRDAAWLATRGHYVTAVEPVQELRQAGMHLHRQVPINWVDDQLPLLKVLRNRGQIFDRVLVNAVWQHLPPQEHDRAIMALYDLVAPDGILVLSLRHGPGHPDRPVYCSSVYEIVRLARENRFSIVLERPASSVQAENRANGVTWTWLGLQKTA